MADEHECTCAATRPLGSPHLPPCPRAEQNVVSIYRNPTTGRPVAVPDEVVSEAEREYRAYKLHVAGKSWPDIAATEMYSSGAAAAAAVKRYLDEGRAVVQGFSRDEVVAVHIGRLNAMREALWGPAVEEKKTTAMMALLAVEDRWVRAFGLDQQQASDTGVQTVVIPSEGYLEELRRLAEQMAQPPDQVDAG